MHLCAKGATGVSLMKHMPYFLMESAVLNSPVSVGVLESLRNSSPYTADGEFRPARICW